MGEINMPREQQEALAAINTVEMDGLIDRSIREERSGELRQALLRCGPYIGRELHSFEKALEAHRDAKAPRKREQTAWDLQRAKDRLSSAVWSMKRRMEEERKDSELFFVEDAIQSPRRFTKNLTVSVHYRWRRGPDDSWRANSIEFSHDHQPRPDYTLPVPRRKLSAAQRERELQNELFQTWEHLMLLGLCAVRDYFKEGGDGAAIPRAFKAKADAYSRGLNNLSTNFWRDGA
jgi:hypothetical protein